MLTKLFIRLGYLLIAIFSVVVFANDPTGQPLTISADNAVVNQTDNVTIYTGNVLLTQGKFRVKC